MSNRQPGEPRRWWLDPVAWVELFAVSNLAFLAVDVSLAHAVNSFAHPAEYVPVAFSLLATLLLVAALWLGGLRPPLASEPTSQRRLARRLGLFVGWASIAVGVAGVVFHLESTFFREQTLKNLVYTAPFVAPLSYAGIGFLVLLNRMVDSRTIDWARWVVLLTLGGFVGNFVLTLADHAQNGFFRQSEWIGVIASAWAVSSLLAVLIVYDNRPLLWLTLALMALQVATGTLGFGLHVLADLRAPADSLWERILYGAPVFAPLLFADLAMLGVLALWGIARHQADAATLGQGSPSG